MIERAGYPGIAADLDTDKIASVLPAMKKQAPRDVGGRREIDRPPGLAARVDAEPRRRRVSALQQP